MIWLDAVRLPISVMTMMTTIPEHSVFTADAAKILARKKMMKMTTAHAPRTLTVSATADAANPADPETAPLPVSGTVDADATSKPKNTTGAAYRLPRFHYLSSENHILPSHSTLSIPNSAYQLHRQHN